MKYSISELQNEVMKIMKITIDICDRNNITYYCQAGTVLGAIRHKGPIPWDEDADLIIPENEINRFVECCKKELPDDYWVNYYTTNRDNCQLFPRIGKKGFSTNTLHLDIFKLIGLPDTREEQIDIINEAIEYRDKARFYRIRYKKTFSSLAHLDFKGFIKGLKIIINSDDSFIEDMQNLCNRYPYENSNYVMNPFGQYKEKNIFLKTIYGKGNIVDFKNFKVRIPSEYDFYLKQYYGDYWKTPSQEKIDNIMKKEFDVK